MFDTFSGLEILTIAVIALVVFGPHRLPEIARTMGKYVRELRDAVRDLREGIEKEVAPLREPIKELREDLAEPVSDVKRTLAETADAAGAVDRDIRQSLEETGRAAPDAATPVPETPEAPEARWVAPEPPVGVSPGEAWKGLDDPMPGNVVPLDAPSPTQEEGPDEEAADPPVGEDGDLGEAAAGREADEQTDRGE
ncbi:MAG: twin-arginine translocase TatA/TatE family subunit [bacterium]|nr:twin-arginine translocase TatA/TatE family subunit [bacterium]MDE0353007.1 twin-arginine translocase TatA/TatE family subunit [bacterium]